VRQRSTRCRASCRIAAMMRHVLEVGQPALEIAGVRLRAIHLEDGLALEIANATGSSIAYNVVTMAVRAPRQARWDATPRRRGYATR
jgi:hypothetical protein